MIRKKKKEKEKQTVVWRPGEVTFTIMDIWIFECIYYVVHKITISQPVACKEESKYVFALILFEWD